MKDFITSSNVSFNWIERLSQLSNFTLYVSDCFWTLKTDDFYEFYYNPRMFMGNIASDKMPNIVLQRIKQYSAIFNKGDIFYEHIPDNKLRPTNIRFRQIERDMRIGNWFHAQGQNYATWKGLFICDDMYVENLERVCSIHDIKGGIVYDMIRMGCQSRTPYYIKSLYDLSIFEGVNMKEYTLPPSEDKEWDANQWKNSFNYLSEYARKGDGLAMQEIRNMRADVFKNTIAIVRKGQYVLNGINYTFSNADTLHMINDTCFYDRAFDGFDCPSLDISTIYFVENSDCLTTAKNLQDKGYNVAVLNMASRRNPGGGVLGGAGAQEENLFRRTNLFQSMYQFADYANMYGLNARKEQYPLERNFGGIYTPDAIVFRGEEKSGYPLLGQDSFYMSFISVPAINRPNMKDATHLADDMIEGTKNKMRTILRIGLIHGHDALVLGALGCGAFCNPPSHIAQLFHEVFEEPEFKNKYRLICFAILDDHNANRRHNPEGNYIPFKREFS